ncbi:MAG: hypothetical protein Q9201_005319, partial [Fulgogasparrea decipioides]
MLAIGQLREAIADTIKEQGGTSRYDSRIMKVSQDDVVLTIFDETLNQHTLQELHDVLDVMLVCAYDKVFR